MKWIQDMKNKMKRSTAEAAPDIAPGVPIPGPGDALHARSPARRMRTVEEARRIDLLKLQRAGFLDAEPGEPFVAGWNDGADDPPHLVCTLAEDHGSIRFLKVVVDGVEKDVDYKVELDRTPCNPGGERVWVRCPECGKRVRILYMPRFEDPLLCRHCHDLDFESHRRGKSRYYKHLKRPVKRWRRARKKLTKERNPDRRKELIQDIIMVRFDLLEYAPPLDLDLRPAWYEPKGWGE